MNTIKFYDQKILSTDMHNPEIINILTENIFDREVKIYNPCNLNIFISLVCQNKCNFCINNNFTNTDITDKEYYSSLEKVLNELYDKGFEITLTGGEPTLFAERFVKTMKMCYERNFTCRTVSTTGYGLFDKYNNKPLYQHMIENNFVHNINISRMHYKEDKNTEIFKHKNINNQDIEILAEFYKINNADMRISCNIIDGYIDNFDKILDFVYFYRNIGINSIIFRELINGNILLKNIVKFNNEFQKIKTLNTALYTIDIYKYKDMIVKYYQSQYITDKNIIYSFSLINGFLKDGFCGKKLEVKLL